MRRVVTLFAVALLVAGCGPSAVGARATASGSPDGAVAAPSGTAPFGEVTAVDGTTIDGGDLAGRDLALWFWAPW